MMDEMLKKLETALEDEKADAEKYMEMAAEAQEIAPDAGYDGILRDIAREEMTHHRHLQAIMADMRAHAGDPEE